MEAQTRCQVSVKIGVVDHVEPPESRHGMVKNVLKVNGKIEDGKTDEDGDPMRESEMAEKSPVPFFGQERHSNGQHREKEMHGERVEGDDRKIGEPAPWPGGRWMSTRSHPFQYGHQGEETEEAGKSKGNGLIH
jgi:hypothetical protein